MTEEQIHNRIRDLNAQSQQLRGNLNAVDGAIQDCQYWLKQIEDNATGLIKDENHATDQRVEQESGVDEHPERD
jgi:hypothetical protein